ncbi:MAG: hypothetical protein KAI27_02200 [Rhodospirillaceae bacterium]|nr:hypothetical protein [Rhodospirillaceae bacterium]
MRYIKRFVADFLEHYIVSGVGTLMMLLGITDWFWDHWWNPPDFVLSGWFRPSLIIVGICVILWAILQKRNIANNTAVSEIIDDDKASSKIRTYESEREKIVYGGGKLTLTHGLGYAPHDIQIFLVCNDSELGYSQDDQVFLSSEDFPMEATSDKKNIYVVGPNVSILRIRRKDGYVHQSSEKYEITQNKWRIKIVAR